MRSSKTVNASIQDRSPLASLKTILYWTSFFGSRDFNFGFGRKPLVDEKCPASDCYLTDNRSLFNQSDVIVFSIQDLNMSDLPQYRFSHQRFVFLEMESPSTTNPVPLLHNKTRFNFFNWTMSYRLDSDIIHRNSYGEIIPHIRRLPARFPEPKNQKKFQLTYDSRVDLRSKQKLVAWFVSHCKTTSHREDYVSELGRYLPIDVYGQCGNLTCINPLECLEMMRRDYKFTIAFENAICRDYMTEKATRPLVFDTVPIVFGGADYEGFLPPHSYIDVKDFESPKQLADYILLLNSSTGIYERYFDWKKHYSIRLYTQRGWCDLCKLASDVRQPPKVYSDILKWWVDDDRCPLP